MALLWGRLEGHVLGPVVLQFLEHPLAFLFAKDPGDGKAPLQVHEVGVEDPFRGGLIVFHRHRAVAPLPGHGHGQADAGAFAFFASHGKGVIEGISGELRLPEHRGHHLVQVAGPLHRHRGVKLGLGAHKGHLGERGCPRIGLQFAGEGLHCRKGGRGWVLGRVHDLHLLLME
jgi:hypothetical protein